MEFLTKPFEDKDLLGAVQQALASDTACRRVETEEAALRAKYGMLTRREREVMGLVVSGFLNKQIASELGTSEIVRMAERLHLSVQLNEIKGHFGRPISSPMFPIQIGVWLVFCGCCDGQTDR